MAKKKCCAYLQRDPGSEIWDPGSGKNLFRIPDASLGVKKAPDPGSGSATLLAVAYSVTGTGPLR